MKVLVAFFVFFVFLLTPLILAHGVSLADSGASFDGESDDFDSDGRKEGNGGDAVRAKRLEIDSKLKAIASERDEKRREILQKRFGKMRAELLKRLDRMENFLERLAERDVNVSVSLAKIADLRLKVEALPENASVADGRALLNLSKQVWKEIVELAKLQAAEFEKKRISDNIKRANGLLQRIERSLDKLQANNVSVSEFRATLAEIRAKLSAANGTYGQDVRRAAFLLHEVNVALHKLQREMKSKVFKERVDRKLEDKISKLEEKIGELKEKLEEKQKELERLRANSTTSGNASNSS